LKPSQKPAESTNRIQSTSALLPRLRLRTRFLLSMLLITAGLTTTSLLLVRRSIQRNVRQGIVVNLRNSVNTFENFQHERETMLTRSAELLADLPITRALMTSTDPVTIQDASGDVWQIAGSDLFVLVDRSGKMVALHTKTPGFTREAAEKGENPDPAEARKQAIRLLSELVGAMVLARAVHRVEPALSDEILQTGRAL